MSEPVQNAESCQCVNCGDSGRFACGRCENPEVGCEDCGMSGYVECLFCVVYPRIEAERVAAQRREEGNEGS